LTPHDEDRLSTTMPERRTASPATPDQTIKRTLDPEPEIEQQKKSWLELSITQVVGGALAAMTAAALGSRFSVEGTVVGAALASVIAAVAGALYTASLRRTHQTVRVVLRRGPTDAAGSASRSAPAQPVPGVSASVAPRSVPSLADTADRSARASRRRGLVVKSVVGALATFALAAGALTLYEALTGHALSGGSGTTFSQVQQDRPEVRPTDEQSPTPSESADPSPTADQPSAEPSVTPEAESSPTAEPSADSSAEPSAEPSVTPEAEPSATAAPPSAAPSQTPRPPR
jgi:hypothetical protein